MQYRVLGKTGIRASMIGFGCNRIAGHNADPAEIAATLDSAFDQGVNFFDTADSYGDGESERLLGRLFRSRRDRVILCTKAGYRSWLRVALENSLPLERFFVRGSRVSGGGGGRLRAQNRPRRNFAPRILQKAIEGSLRRLQTDYLDIFYLHSPPPEVVADPRVFEALEQLKDRGWIRCYGVSFAEAATTEEVLAALRHPGLSVLQVQVNPRESVDLRRIVPAAGDLALIARQPFGRGMLLEADRFPGLPERRPRAQAILRSVLQQEGVCSVLVGMRSRLHLQENLGALEGDPLQDDEMARLYDSVRIY